MGLVEEEWLDTLSSIDKNDLIYIDYVESAKKLSREMKVSIYSINLFSFLLQYQFKFFKIDQLSAVIVTGSGRQNL